MDSRPMGFASLNLQKWPKKMFGGHDPLGSRKKNLENLNLAIGGSVVWASYLYYKRQLETAFFQLGPDQTSGSRKKFFFDAKILR